MNKAWEIQSENLKWTLFLCCWEPMKVIQGPGRAPVDARLFPLFPQNWVFGTAVNILQYIPCRCRNTHFDTAFLASFFCEFLKGFRLLADPTFLIYCVNITGDKRPESVPSIIALGLCVLQDSSSVLTILQRECCFHEYLLPVWPR